MKKIIVELKKRNVDERWLKRYIKFVSTFGVQQDYPVYKENHHILPSSIFPEYKKLKNFKWNSVLLTGKGHFIAHFILCKLFIDIDDKNKMLFAFNNMKRIDNSGSLYGALKEEGSKAIQMCNKDRIVYHNQYTGKEIRLKQDDIVPDSYIKGVSAFTINQRIEFQKENILVKDTSGGVFYITRGEFALRDELVTAAKGRKHSKETKKKMSDNGIKGRKKYHNHESTIFLKENETVPEGFILGELPSKTEAISKTVSSLKSYHNPNTGDSIRIKGEPPKGYIKGRGPFNNVGTKGKTPYTNGYKIVCLSPKEEIPDGFWKGNKSMKMFEIYDNNGNLIETIGRIEATEKYSSSIISASKEKPMCSNKAYLSRLSQLTLTHPGWYSVSLSMKDFLSKKHL